MRLPEQKTMFISFQMICDSDRQTTKEESAIFASTGPNVPPAMTRFQPHPDNFQQSLSEASQRHYLPSVKQKSDDLTPTLAEADSQQIA
jgi:hypothetical protein